MIVYYHHDLDGECSAAIVRKIANEKGLHVRLVPMKYNTPLNIFPIKDEEVFIVDFTFNPVMLESVLEITPDVTWIDHHKSSIHRHSPLSGLRSEEFSACELTWKYIHGSTPMPKTVELIGDMDKWAWKHKETMSFTEGIKQYDTRPDNKFWDVLLSLDTRLVNIICEQGEICVRYRDSICNQYTRDYGFDCKFDGYETFAVGLELYGSLTFGDKIDQYDICATFEFNGVDWTIGLYSKKIDVSELALKHGGGGHVGAAGFICNYLPFKR